jgi:hypothetical protein
MVTNGCKQRIANGIAKPHKKDALMFNPQKRFVYVYIWTFVANQGVQK